LSSLVQHHGGSVNVEAVGDLRRANEHRYQVARCDREIANGNLVTRKQVSDSKVTDGVASHFRDHAGLP
jgi:hypothetical protein